jgi:hypothetical protein
MLYCKRWRLRYWWYLLNKLWHREIEVDNYDYDAFVAYDYEDFQWVQHHLLPELEEKRGLRLCIHHRDFPGGEYLEEIIVDCIHRSRKVVLLLTPKFVRSRWCEFEFSIARNRLFESGVDVIVPVILQPLPAACVNGRLLQVLKKRLYLEWVDNNSIAQNLFWHKLADGIRPAWRGRLVKEEQENLIEVSPLGGYGINLTTASVSDTQSS